MKRYTFNPRLGVMVESTTGEWVLHAEAKHAADLARFRKLAPKVKGAEAGDERLPVKLMRIDAPGDGVDIDRVHRRAAALEIA